MEIIYTENPLSIIVKLNNEDREIMGQKIIEESRLTISNPIDINKHIKNLVNFYESSLQSTHMGDCTGIPASCSKCRAEIYLGIDTLDNLNHGSANYILDAFVVNNTCNDAIEYLKQNSPHAKESWQHKHIERWKHEHKLAIEFLENYLESKINN